MRAVPPGARAYVLCAGLGAVASAAPVLIPLLPLRALVSWGRSGPAAPVPGALWAAVALLALLCHLCERPAGGAFWRRRLFTGAGGQVPILLAGAFLLPPAAAALVPWPAALAGRTERPVWLRRLWEAARQGLACWAAAHAFRVFGPVGPRALDAADVPRLLLPAVTASLVFCLVLTALDGGARAAAGCRPARTAWRGLLLRSLAPHLAHGPAGLMMAVLWRSPYGPPAALIVLLPMGVFWWIVAQYQRERAAHQATVRALVQAVDLKDRYTRGHGERVGRASAMMARELGMADDRVGTLHLAGLLHDVGKIGVPTRLLRKDGRLTPEERRAVELHPEYGHEMVRGVDSLREARAAILHHHERLDGRGYPHGLRGTQIPECARMVAVADAFDAMTSHRSYRRARPVEEALTELRRCSGTQFDPRMVGALARALGRHGWPPALPPDAPAPPARRNVPPPASDAVSVPGAPRSAAPAPQVPRAAALAPDPCAGPAAPPRPAAGRRRVRAPHRAGRSAPGGTPS